MKINFMMLMFSWPSHMISDTRSDDSVNEFISHSQGQWSVMKVRFHEERSCFQVYWNPSVTHQSKGWWAGNTLSFNFLLDPSLCQRFQRVNIPAHPYTVTDTRVLQQLFRAGRRALGPVFLWSCDLWRWADAGSVIRLLWHWPRLQFPW